MSGAEAQRIDKWLWHARFARTRSAAQRLAVSGLVRVNREKDIAASRLVRPGDVLTLALGRGIRVVRISANAAPRGSAAETQLLYEDAIGPAPAASAQLPQSGE
jgi:ribosome-associated heat shock protein Hsp15